MSFSLRLFLCVCMYGLSLACLLHRVSGNLLISRCLGRMSIFFSVFFAFRTHHTKDPET